MKKLIISILISILFISVQAQEKKYFIYLKDKGTNSGLMKTNPQIKENIKKTLSEETIKRRTKVLGENIISEDDIPVFNEYINKLTKTGINIKRKLKWFNAVSANLSQAQLETIQKLDFVDKIEPIRSLAIINPEMNIQDSKSLRKTNNVNNYKYIYGPSLGQMELSEVPAVHDLDITGKDIIIGLIDSGFKTEGVPSLSSRTVIAMKDFIQDDNNTANENGETSQDSHGTRVFSACGGFDNGNMVSPAFDAKYLLAKTENVTYEKNVEEDDFVAACEWLEANGAQIVSSSLGYSEFDQGENSYTYEDMDGKTSLTTKAYNKLYENGIITVTSAGNDGDKIWKYISSPADAFGCISVGSVDSKNDTSDFSSFGPTSDGRIKPEVCAQGTSTYLNYPSGKYSTANGTSFSAPIVAGIIGQLLSAHPHLTNKQVRNIVILSGDHPYAPEDQRGYGLLSAKKAVGFPNLEKTNNGFKLHKIFFADNGIQFGSAKVNIINNGTEQSYNLDVTSKSYKFVKELPGFNSGDNIELYFTYKTDNGTEVREPASENYKLTYGQMNFTSVETEIDTKTDFPENFNLSQNYPNPFNPSTTLTYTIAEETNVKIEIYNILGEKIKTIVDEIQTPGNHTVKIHTSKLGVFSSGVYFYRLITDKFIDTKKMMIIK